MNVYKQKGRTSAIRNGMEWNGMELDGTLCPSSVYYNQM